MKKIIDFEIVSNDLIANDVYCLTLSGDTSWFEKPGQFVDIKCDGLFLRRPISITDVDNEILTLIYKVVGEGTRWLSKQKIGFIECLVGLGNGFEIYNNNVLLVGGGVGVPPLYKLAKEYIKRGYDVTCVFGFQNKKDIFLIDEFEKIGTTLHVCTNDGSYGYKGFVTDVINELKLNDMKYSACGPKPMLKALSKTMNSNGQLSFEERMGCGYGACMGCSMMTKKGPIRVCREGPVLNSEDIIWED